MKKHKLLLLIPTLAIAAGLTSYSYRNAERMERDLASPQYVSDTSHLRMKIVSLTDKRPQDKAVLIAMDRSDSPEGFFTTDSESLGFGYDPSLKTIEPLFLFFVNELGVHQVYSFKIGTFNTNTNGIMPKLKGTDVEWRIKYPASYPGLPFLLTDAQAVTAHQFAYQADRLLWELVTLTPASIIVKPIRRNRAEMDNMGETQAKLLASLLDEGLKSGAFAELKAILNDTQVDELEAALDANQGRQNTIKNMLFSNMEKRVIDLKLRKGEIVDKSTLPPKLRSRYLPYSPDFPQYVKVDPADNAFELADVKKMKVVADAAEKEGLVLIPFGSDSGVLAIDVTQPYDEAKVHRIISQERIDAVLEKYNKGEGGRLIGISAFSTKKQAWISDDETGDNRLIYDETLNLGDTKGQLREQEFFNCFKLARALGYSIAPMGVSLGLAYGEGWIGLAAEAAEEKVGEFAKHFDNRLARTTARILTYKFVDLSDLMAASELGYLVPDAGDQGKFFAAILGFVGTEIDPGILAHYKSQLMSKDPAVQTKATRGLFMLYLSTVENAQYGMNHTTQKQRVEAESIYAQRLENWMADRNWVECHPASSCREKQSALMTRRWVKESKKRAKAAAKLAKAEAKRAKAEAKLKKSGTPPVEPSAGLSAAAVQTYGIGTSYPAIVDEAPPVTP